MILNEKKILPGELGHVNIMNRTSARNDLNLECISGRAVPKITLPYDETGRHAGLRLPYDIH
jgi:hypothetical protein